MRDKIVCMVDWRLTSSLHRCYRDLGIPIPKTLVILASPSHIASAIWVIVRVRVTGDAHIIRVWEWGCTKRGDTHITVTPASSRFLSLHERCLPRQHTAVQFFFFFFLIVLTLL